MTVGRQVMATLIGVVLVLTILAVSVRLYMNRDAESRVSPEENIDFAKLTSTKRRNVFVACPASLCPSSANIPSPVFLMKWERLRDYWREMIAAQPRVEQVSADADHRRFVYIQRSAVFRFPDIITVEFLPVEGGNATLAIHSQSRYGELDFDVNRNRVTEWLALLQRMMRDEQRAKPSAG